MGSVIETAAREKVEEYKFKPYTLRERLPKNINTRIPRGRSGHRIVSDNSSMYSFGGYNPVIDIIEIRNDDIDGNLTLFKELWRFNLCTDEWQKLTYYHKSLPEELASNAVLMKGNTLIVHGGTGVPFGITCTNKTYVTNLKDDKAMKLLNTKGSLPAPQYGQAMVLFGHKLYVVGGTSGFAYSADVHSLDLKTGIWEAQYICKGKRMMEPEKRYRHEVALLGTKIIVFGGGTVDDAFGFQQLPTFNIETKEWEVMNTYGDPNCETADPHQGFPAPRRCHGGVQIPEDALQNPEFIVCGGYDGQQIFSDIWKLNFKTMQWTKFQEELFHPLYFHSTSVTPSGQMLIFGGICDDRANDDDSSKTRTSDVFSIWVKMPRLSEICWDALLYYNPELPKYPKSKLLQSGIPIQFVNRIPNVVVAGLCDDIGTIEIR